MLPQSKVLFAFSVPAKRLLHYGSVNQIGCGPVNSSYGAGLGLFFPQIALGSGEKRLNFSFSCRVLKLLMLNWNVLETFLVFYSIKGICLTTQTHHGRKCALTLLPSLNRNNEVKTEVRSAEEDGVIWVNFHRRQMTNELTPFRHVWKISTCLVC